jgi:hypothetical protein
MWWQGLTRLIAWGGQLDPELLDDEGDHLIDVLILVNASRVNMAEQERRI